MHRRAESFTKKVATTSHTGARHRTPQRSAAIAAALVAVENPEFLR
jgi:hypothetical protein